MLDSSKNPRDGKNCQSSNNKRKLSYYNNHNHVNQAQSSVKYNDEKSPIMAESFIVANNIKFDNTDNDKIVGTVGKSYAPILNYVDQTVLAQKLPIMAENCVEEHHEFNISNDCSDDPIMAKVFMKEPLDNLKDEHQKFTPNTSFYDSDNDSSIEENHDKNIIIAEILESIYLDQNIDLEDQVLEDLDESDDDIDYNDSFNIENIGDSFPALLFKRSKNFDVLTSVNQLINTKIYNLKNSTNRDVSHLYSCSIQSFAETTRGTFKHYLQIFSDLRRAHQIL